MLAELELFAHSPPAQGPLGDALVHALITAMQATNVSCSASFGSLDTASLLLPS